MGRVFIVKKKKKSKLEILKEIVLISVSAMLMIGLIIVFLKSYNIIGNGNLGQVYRKLELGYVEAKIEEEVISKGGFPLDWTVVYKIKFEDDEFFKQLVNNSNWEKTPMPLDLERFVYEEHVLNHIALAFSEEKKEIKKGEYIPKLENGYYFFKYRSHYESFDEYYKDQLEEYKMMMGMEQYIENEEEFKEEITKNYSKYNYVDRYTLGIYDMNMKILYFVDFKL